MCPKILIKEGFPGIELILIAGSDPSPSEKRNMMGDYSELLQLLTSQQETIKSLSRTIENLTTVK